MTSPNALTPNNAQNGKSIHFEDGPNSGHKRDENITSLGVVAIRELLELGKNGQGKQGIDQKRNSNFKDFRNQNQALTIEEADSPYVDIGMTTTLKNSIISPI